MDKSMLHIMFEGIQLFFLPIIIIIIVFLLLFC